MTGVWRRAGQSARNRKDVADDRSRRVYLAGGTAPTVVPCPSCPPARPIRPIRPVRPVRPVRPARGSRPVLDSQPPCAGRPAPAGRPASAGQPPCAGRPAPAGRPASAGQPLCAGRPALAGTPTSAGQSACTGRVQPLAVPDGHTAGAPACRPVQPSSGRTPMRRPHPPSTAGRAREGYLPRCRSRAPPPPRPSPPSLPDLRGGMTGPRRTEPGAFHCSRLRARRLASSEDSSW